VAKGKKLQSHIHNIEEIQKLGQDHEIHAKCVRQASIHKAEYKLDVIINADREVVSAWCSCTAGMQAKCKHLGGLIAAVSSEREESRTDQQCRWYKPKEKAQELYPKGKKFEDIFKFSKPAAQQIRGDLSEQEKRDHLELLTSVGDSTSMMYRLLTAKIPPPPPPVVYDQPCFVDEIFISRSAPFRFMIPNGSKYSSELSLLPDDMRLFYEDCVQVDSSKAKNICSSTRKQSGSSNWFLERQLRITASQSHKIRKGRKECTRWKYFEGSPPDLASLRYGHEMEPIAREAFSRSTGFSVSELGLVTRVGQGWIGASPDGIFKDSDGNVCLLEIKCPFSCKESKIRTDYIVNGSLKTTHEYYCQVQIQLYCCDLQVCHFFVYSTSDQVHLIVTRDDEFL
jgi:putative phage-type endonuclease